MNKNEGPTNLHNSWNFNRFFILYIQYTLAISAKTRLSQHRIHVTIISQLVHEIYLRKKVSNFWSDTLYVYKENPIKHENNHSTMWARLCDESFEKIMFGLRLWKKIYLENQK